MAEQSARDVVKEAQSVGSSMPIDDIAKPTNITTADDGTSLPTPPNPAIHATREAAQTDTQPVSGNEEIVRQHTDGGKPLQTSSSNAEGQRTATDPSETTILNGTGVNHLTAEEAQQQNAAAEVSGGSDTDTRGHARTGSVKKPTFFKTSSVTKNFLAKTASSTPPAPGVKAPATPSQGISPIQANAKPRLVAKSGSGLGNIPRSGIAKQNGTAGGPDASKVWNKNQPVPPPPPKQFTDEELKQQYGIHMATRLQADDPSKDQSKWADIDDDEDDWVPETVEWMDGTKSAVAAAENQPPPVEEIRPVSQKQEKPIERAQPVQSVQQTPEPTAAPPVPRPTSTGGAKTILKPGAAAQNTPLRPGVVLKGVPEKAGSVAKPAAPAPPKSPWASLPPVEKAPPLMINPPVQQPPQSRFAQRDAHGFDALPPMPLAKEIAADDFSRNWRDERGTKELYNSQSGRYEPVNDARRGSFRESHQRQPSVLQRPNQGLGAGPAEPSAAFQTSRAGQDAGSWTRRRASSNVSGGSGGRRMSFGRPQDGHPFPAELPPALEVQPATGSDNVMSGNGDRANVDQQRNSASEMSAPNQQNPAQRPSPATSHAQPLSPFGSVQSSGPAETLNAPTPGEDPVVVQQQLMKDNIERAREAKRRRDEDEAKAEAAKKERIQKLMAQLEEKNKSDSPAVSALPSPPKPPVPTADGEVTQYGMIKVHSSTTVKRASPSTDIHAPAPATALASVTGPVSGRDAPHRPPVRGNNNATTSNSTTGSAATVPTTTSPPHRAPIDDSPSAKKFISESGPTDSHKSETHPPRSTHISPSAPQDQAWKPPQPTPDTFQPWGANLQSQSSLSSSSVWGPPPSKDKPLGNGTFDTGYGRAAARQSNAQGSQSGPGPIAPPTKLSPVPSQSVPHHIHGHEQQRGFAHPDIRLPPVAPIGAPSPNQGFPQSTQPGPIAPPARNMPGMQAPRFSVGDWGALASNASQHDAALVAARNEVVKKAAGGSKRIEETFKRTAPSHTLGERRVVKTEQYLHDHKASSERDQVQDRIENLPQHHIVPPHMAPHPMQALHPAASQQHMNKASRFFPQAQGPKQPQLFAPALNGIIPGIDSDSPPPPDTISTGHPAFDTDVAQPKVNLPAPKAVVKLPPAAGSPQQAVLMPGRPQAPIRLGSQPIASSEAWQDRFNGLFGRVGRTPSHPKPVSPNPPAAVVSSSSKTALVDVTPQRSSATVSLPSKGATNKASAHAIFATDNSSEAITRVSASEALLEERDFGSLPVVNFGKHDYANAGGADFASIRVHPNVRIGGVKPVHATSVDILPFSEERNHGNLVLQITLPGDVLRTTKLMPRTHINENAKGRKTSGYQGNKAKRNVSSRGENANATNATANAHPRKSSHSNHNQTNSPGTPRSGSQWNNERSNAARNASSWSRRTAPAAVH